MTADDHYRRWRLLAPLGLLAVGAGLSVVGEATLRKHRGDRWMLWGTAGLVLTNAGLAMLGDGVKHRALFDWQTTNTDCHL